MRLIHLVAASMLMFSLAALAVGRTVGGVDEPVNRIDVQAIQFVHRSTSISHASA